MANDLYIPKTLHEAIQHFSDPEVAQEFFVTLRWPDGVTCPHCDGKSHYYAKTERRWQCKDCRKRFSVKTGTIMEDSPLKLELWLTATWIITGAKNGISSCEVARALGITQKTAGKEIVVGYYANGEVHTEQVPVMNQDQAQAHIRKHVEPGSTLHTDTSALYKGMADYSRKSVNHAVGQYAKEDGTTTNHLENYWSVLKRAIKGSYIHVSPELLSRYLAEGEFRYNNRKTNDQSRFAIATASMNGKRLTYTKLIEA